MEINVGLVRVVQEGKKIKCGSCKKKFFSLHLILETNEELCDDCFEIKGGMGYILELRLLDKEFPRIVE